MTTAITTNVLKDNRRQLRELLSREDVIDSIQCALGKYMDAREYLAQMVIAFQREEIASCTVASQYECVRALASLILNPALGHVALIPRNTKDKGRVCTYMIQWQGMLALIMRTPNIVDCRVTLVHTMDRVEVDGTTQTVVSHSMDPFHVDRVFNSLRDIQGGYIVVEFIDGRKKYHFVNRETIRKARACAQTNDIWDAWFKEMAYKTIIRDAFGRRVVAMDPVVSQIITEQLEREDRLLGNNPRRVAPPQRDPADHVQLMRKAILPPAPAADEVVQQAPALPAPDPDREPPSRTTVEPAKQPVAKSKPKAAPKAEPKAAPKAATKPVEASQVPQEEPPGDEPPPGVGVPVDPLGDELMGLEDCQSAGEVLAMYADLASRYPDQRKRVDYACKAARERFKI